MKFSFNNAIAASLHLTSISSSPNNQNLVAAFLSFPNSGSSGSGSSTTTSSNSNSNSNNHNACLYNVQQTTSPTSTALLMSVSDEERVNHFQQHHQHQQHQHQHQHHQNNLFPSNGAGAVEVDQEEEEEVSLISALVETNGYHTNNNNNNGYHSTKNGYNTNTNTSNGHNGQSQAAAASTAPIIDSNGVEYKLTNGQAAPKANGSNGKHQHQHQINGHVNGHTPLSSNSININNNNNSNNNSNNNNNNNNKNNFNIPVSSIESIVEERVMAEVELQAQQLAEQEVELNNHQQTLERSLQKQSSNVDNVELQVEDFNNLDYKGSSSSYFGGAGGEVRRRAAGNGILPEDNPVAMDIIQNTEVMGVGVGSAQDSKNGSGKGLGAGPTTGTTAENLVDDGGNGGNGIVGGSGDVITLDPLIETTKLAPTKLTSKELHSMEKVKEDEVVNNQAFHHALEQKVVKDVESATERIAEECTFATTSTVAVPDADVDAADTSADATVNGKVVKVNGSGGDDVSDATNSQESKLSKAPPKPQLKEGGAAAADGPSTLESHANFKPFSPLPKVKAPPKNGQYLDVLSSSTPKRRTRKRRGKSGSGVVGGYLNQLQDKNVKAIAGSGISGYLDDITVQQNLNRARFRIPFIGRLWNRNVNGSGVSTKDTNVYKNDNEVVEVAPLEEEENTVELKSEDDDSLTLEEAEEVGAETDVSSGTVSSSDIADVNEPLEDDSSTSEIPKVLLSFDVTSDIKTTDVEVDDVLEDVEDKDLDDLVNSYIHTNSSKIKVLSNTASQGNYLSSLEHKTKVEQINKPKPEVNNDVVVATGNNYLESLNGKESAATLSGSGPSTYLTQLENHEINTAKRNTSNVRRKLFKLSNAVALLCFLEVGKPILSYALPVGGIGVAANLITTKNAFLSFSGTLGFAMMYVANSISQVLPQGRVLKQAVNLVGCALLLTSNYFSQRSGNKKK